MKTILLFLGVFLSPVCFGELVCLRFSVTDYDGRPIQGATIALETAKKRILPYARAEYKEFSCTTDKEGLAAERFFCWDGKVLCTVSAEGFYPERIRDVGFKTNYDRKNKETVFLEDEKHVAIKLRMIKNPQKLVRHRILKGNVSFPSKDGVFGYDLEIGDWVKPNGLGEHADFSLDYHWVEDEEGVRCRGAVIFTEKGAGAYVASKSSCAAFPVAYEANTNFVYETSIPFVCCNNPTTGVSTYQNPLGSDEYMVIRSRVVLDEKGKIVKANYSQIHGPFAIGRYIEFKDSYFNPTVNDTNLEYEQNLRYSNARR